MNNIKISIFILIINTVTAFATVHEVMVSSNRFTPANIQIEAGDTVRWINTGGAHNVRAEDGSFRCAQGCEANGGNGTPSTDLWISEITFRSVDFITYICEPHERFGMRGSITIVEPTSALIQTLSITQTDHFTPNDLTIQAGEILRIQNISGVHNFHAQDDSLICSQACLGDGITTATNNPTAIPWDIFIKFENSQEIPYFCAEHPSFTGIIHIQGDVLFTNGFE